MVLGDFVSGCEFVMVWGAICPGVARLGIRGSGIGNVVQRESSRFGFHKISIGGDGRGDGCQTTKIFFFLSGKYIKYQ
jgi:hypothetical protein